MPTLRPLTNLVLASNVILVFIWIFRNHEGLFYGALLGTSILVAVLILVMDIESVTVKSSKEKTSAESF
ncbi:MAG: hypothetical protein R2827_13110 [Bdellovibrionales bacterium]